MIHVFTDTVECVGDQVGHGQHGGSGVETVATINEQTVADEANIPFGGVGASGTGSRFGGAEANIEAFTETQWLTVRPDIAPYPF